MAKIQNKKMASAQYSSRKKAKDKIEAQENANWKAWNENKTAAKNKGQLTSLKKAKKSPKKK